ncbi:hypothetical protein LG047_12640 [Methylocystis sp. WRRC1]|uniref:hypothetical protein n=1 Tax=unclassified Methylocystis TaxID=2625913 RepID=UPI0001F8685B|nr:MULTISPECIES: hypothetical protein [unclassified Methylocystis]MCC3246157.1 hypothetical protein [Methylocystis sp. WRRC1]
MRSIAVILTTLSIGSEALAMGGPVYVDSTCETMRAAKASPALKQWLKSQCPKGEASANTICADLAPFIRDVAANNENYRRKCGGAQ